MTKFADMYVEQSVIGSLLIATLVEDLQDSAMDAIENLQEDDFTSAAHRIAIRGIKRLHASGSKIDLLTLSADLEQTGEIEIAGGFGYRRKYQKHSVST